VSPSRTSIAAEAGAVADRAHARELDEAAQRVARSARVGRAATSVRADGVQHAAAALHRLLLARADREAGALLALVVEWQTRAARGGVARLELAGGAALTGRATA